MSVYLPIKSTYKAHIKQYTKQKKIIISINNMPQQHKHYDVRSYAISLVCNIWD